MSILRPVLGYFYTFGTYMVSLHSKRLYEMMLFQQKGKCLSYRYIETDVNMHHISKERVPAKPH